MKILNNIDAWINGKLYKAGSPVPKESEKDLSDHLIDAPDKIEIKVTLDSEKSDSLNKGNSKKNK